jgi:hypothetical protein
LLSPFWTSWFQNLEPNPALGKVRTGARLARQNFMGASIKAPCRRMLGDLAHMASAKGSGSEIAIVNGILVI